MAYENLSSSLDGNGTNLETEQKVAEEARAARDKQEEADTLKRQANTTDDETLRQDLLDQSELREREAHEHSKEARHIASGAWQGSAAGAGIGTSLGTGTGALVGTLVGTVAAIPMAGLGALIGLPIGFFHGPFFGKEQGDEEQMHSPSEAEQHLAVIQALNSAEKAEEATNREPPQP